MTVLPDAGGIALAAFTGDAFARTLLNSNINDATRAPAPM